MLQHSTCTLLRALVFKWYKWYSKTEIIGHEVHGSEVSSAVVDLDFSACCFDVLSFGVKICEKDETVKEWSLPFHQSSGALVQLLTWSVCAFEHSITERYDDFAEAVWVLAVTTEVNRLWYKMCWFAGVCVCFDENSRISSGCVSAHQPL